MDSSLPPRHRDVAGGRCRGHEVEGNIFDNLALAEAFAEKTIVDQTWVIGQAPASAQSGDLRELGLRALKDGHLTMGCPSFPRVPYCTGGISFLRAETPLACIGPTCIAGIALCPAHIAVQGQGNRFPLGTPKGCPFAA